MKRIPRWLFKGAARKVKWTFQKIFRKSHTSDPDLWSLDYFLAKKILPALKDFRKQDLNGYPSEFSSFEEASITRSAENPLTKEEYEDLYVGGGFDKWLATIDKMIFGFEYTIAQNECSEEKFYKKYNLKDPYEKIEENAWDEYVYETNVNGSIGTCWSPHELDEEGYTFVEKRKKYYNDKLHRSYLKKAQEGLELFGKHFTSLWD